MSTKSEFDTTFYDDRVWGSSEIDPQRKGIDLLKLERLIEAEKSWSGKRCLEVGCGTGRYLRGVSRLLSGNEVCLAGTDISKKSLNVAQTLGCDVEYRVMENFQVPWEDQSFDVVCFLDVMEHVEDPAAFLTESMRVLKVGGVLHASVPMEGDFRCLWRWFDFIGLHDRTKRLDGQIQRFTKKSLKAVFSGCGMELVREFYSYQIIGNLLDFALFNWLNIRRAMGHSGSHYEIVTASRSNKASLAGCIASLAEAAMYWEGRALGPFAGMNAHLTYRRIK
ncbi:MAG: class I SAM-dependent methyltransferase [Verrucomicrobiota bacterium]